MQFVSFNRIIVFFVCKCCSSFQNMMQWLLVHLSLLKNLCGRKLKQLQLSQRYVSIACRMPNLLFLHNYRRRARLPVVLQVTTTTENSRFAVCHKHSAKPKKHSAKDLSSATLDKQHTASIVLANGSLPSVFYRALGKDFAES